MKTITQLTAALKESPQSAVASPTYVRISQSQKGFERTIRAAATGLYFESSSGGQIFVSHADLWKMVEPHDEKLIKPATLQK